MAFKSEETLLVAMILVATPLVTTAIVAIALLAIDCAIGNSTNGNRVLGNYEHIYRKVASTNASRFETRLDFKHT